MKRFLLVMFTFIILGCGMASAKTYTYKMYIGAFGFDVKYSITEDENYYLIENNMFNRMEMKIYCNKNWETEKMVIMTKKYTNERYREGNIIYTSIVSNGIITEKTAEIDELPWIALPHFQLSRFALSEKEEIVFWQLKDDMNAFKTIVKAKEEKTVKIKNEEEKAYFLSVPMSSDKKIIDSECYYRIDEGELLMYSMKTPVGKMKMELKKIEDTKEDNK